MAETAAPRDLEEATGIDLLPRLREFPFAAGFAVLGLLLAAYAGAALLAHPPRPLLRADDPFGLDSVFRMNLVLSSIVAYTTAVGLLEFRLVPRELGRLRALLDCDDAVFEAAVRASVPDRLQALLALGLGGLFGAAVTASSQTLIAGLGNAWDWDFHTAWNGGLTVLLFALLALLALWGTRSAALYSSLSRRFARVDLLDLQPFQLFAARGLRLALYWFLGSSLALLLAVDAREKEVVLATTSLTFALSAASLVLPSLGIHQRTRREKAAELARVRGEIQARLAALRRGHEASAAELPALLAWEARVAQVPEWPLGGAVLARFTLLVLLPIGSWLGGALVERLVDAALG